MNLGRKYNFHAYLERVRFFNLGLAVVKLPHQLIRFNFCPFF